VAPARAATDDATMFTAVGFDLLPAFARGIKGERLRQVNAVNAVNAVKGGRVGARALAAQFKANPNPNPNPKTGLEDVTQ
jgi:hypothetical protein